MMVQASLERRSREKHSSEASVIASVEECQLKIHLQTVEMTKQSQTPTRHKSASQANSGWV